MRNTDLTQPHHYSDREVETSVSSALKKRALESDPISISPSFSSFHFRINGFLKGLGHASQPPLCRRPT